MFAYNFFVGGSGGFQAVRTEYYTIDSDPFVFGLFPAITRIPIAPIFTEVTPNDIRRRIWDNMPPLIEYDDVPDFPPEHPPAEVPGDFPGLRGVAFEDALAQMPIPEYDDEDFFGNVRPFFPRIRGRVPIPRPPLRTLRRLRLLLFLPPARGRRPFFAEHEHLGQPRKLIVQRTLKFILPCHLPYPRFTSLPQSRSPLATTAFPPSRICKSGTICSA